MLLDRWQLARESEGQIVLLAGEPGIGKSRILSALRERLEAQGAQALRFQCSPYYVNSAFWPSIDNFERALKFARDEPPDSKLDKLEALIASQYGRPRSDVRFIASMLSIPCEERYGAITMTPQKFKDETLRTLVDLTEAAARKQPSLMLFEDLHWADPTSLEVLDLLIDRVRTIPLLIVLTHRPEFQSRWSQHGHVTSLNLSKLTRTQSAAIVAKLANGKALPGDLLDQILAKTDGVPLYVEELTKTILESSELKEASDRYEYAGTTHSITVPATLRDSLMARLDRYAPVKEVAQIGAAIGREFSYELIAAVAPINETQLASALAQLTESGLAFRKGTPPDATYSFKHALVQDAAYDSLLKTKRQELHAQIAKAIEGRFPNMKETEPEVLARHYTEARLAEQAVPHWIATGQRALARMAAPEAVRHLTTALQVNETLPASNTRDRQELDIRQMLSTAHLIRSGWHAIEITHALEPAPILATQLGDKRKLVTVLNSLWLNRTMRIQYAEALVLVGELHALARENDESGDLVTAWAADTLTHCWTGDFKQSERALQQALATYDLEQHSHLVHTYGYDPKCACLLWGGFTLWALGYPDRARQSSAAAVELARMLNHAWNLAWVLSLGTMNPLECGETAGPRRWLEEAYAIAQDQALIPLLEVEHPYHYGLTLVVEGNFEEGYARMLPASRTWREIGWLHPLPHTNLHQAIALGGMGRIEEALTLIAEALQIMQTSGQRMHEAEAYRIDGELRLMGSAPDLGAAQTSFLMSLEVARLQEAKSWELRASTCLGRLWQSQGKCNEALDLLKPVYDWFTEGFDTKDLKEAKALLDELRSQ